MEFIAGHFSKVSGKGQSLKKTNQFFHQGDSYNISLNNLIVYLHIFIGLNGLGFKLVNSK